VLGTSLIPTAIRTLLEKQAGETFTGTATELLEALNGVVDEGVSRRREWPKGANVLSGQLKRLAPALRTDGVDVDEDQSAGSGSTKTWTLRIRPVSGKTEAPGGPSGPSNTSAQRVRVA
jgi:hypothetical protein